MTKHSFKVGDVVRIGQGAVYGITVPGSVGCVVSLRYPDYPRIKFVNLAESVAAKTDFGIYQKDLELATHEGLTDDEIVALVALVMENAR